MNGEKQIKTVTKNKLCFENDLQLVGLRRKYNLLKSHFDLFLFFCRFSITLSQFWRVLLAGDEVPLGETLENFQSL